MIDNEDTTEVAINRGHKARELLDNPLLQEVFAALDASYIQAWRVAPARDTEMRERLWQAVNIIGMVRDHLSTIVANGKLAETDLNMRLKKPR